ncbi:hypothetical protein BSL78_10138 [Apostichopus japonicus]|uniref:Uncharacterized protein n=1 Tax=Stichopus japonicus TaxID=307972 RepID=A0A2G8KY89_STIJA|nr:hypothetical protein BSL78_10138 [Apostichopus japonicus]
MSTGGWGAVLGVGREEEQQMCVGRHWRIQTPFCSPPWPCNRFRDLLMAMKLISTGHRSGVLLNLTAEEFSRVERFCLQDGSVRWTIKISDHKTLKSHGPTHITIDQTTYNLMLVYFNVVRPHLLRGRVATEAEERDTPFFLSNNGNRVRRLKALMVAVGLSLGVENFSPLNLRKTAATLAVQSETAAGRSRVAQAMSHTEYTQGRYYNERLAGNRPAKQVPSSPVSSMGPIQQRGFQIPDIIEHGRSTTLTLMPCSLTVNLRTDHKSPQREPAAEGEPATAEEITRKKTTIPCVPQSEPAAKIQPTAEGEPATVQQDEKEEDERKPKVHVKSFPVFPQPPQIAHSVVNLSSGCQTISSRGTAYHQGVSTEGSARSQNRRRASRGGASRTAQSLIAPLLFFQGSTTPSTSPTNTRHLSGIPSTSERSTGFKEETGKEEEGGKKEEDFLVEMEIHKGHIGHLRAIRKVRRTEVRGDGAVQEECPATLQTGALESNSGIIPAEKRRMFRNILMALMLLNGGHRGRVITGLTLGEFQAAKQKTNKNWVIAVANHKRSSTTDPPP